MSRTHTPAHQAFKRFVSAAVFSILGVAALSYVNAEAARPEMTTVQAVGRIDGHLTHIERCDDFFVDSILSPVGDLYPGFRLIPLLGALFGHDVPDPAWVLVRKGDPNLAKFRNATGVITESVFVGDYPGGSLDLGVFRLDNLSSLGDEAVVNYEDFPDVHDSHDMNFFLKLDDDPSQADLISTFGIDSTGTETGDPGYFPDTLEVEWETGILTSQRTGDGRFFPKWAWPLPGDRVWVNGYWVFDCGHVVQSTETVPGPNGFPVHPNGIRSEIHPPRAVASMRRAIAAPPTNPQPIAVTEADVYVHGRAGIVVDLLECGGRVILDNRDCPTRSGQTPKGRDSSSGDPGHDIALDHLGIPIDENFEFTICTPALPASGGTRPALAFWEQRVTPDNTVAVDSNFTVQDATGGCAGAQYGPKQLLVKIPLAGTGVTPDDVYARRIFVGWSTPPERLRRMRVTVNSMLLVKDLEDDHFGTHNDCECVWFWSSVDRAPEKLIRLSDKADDLSHMNSFGDGTSQTFTNATWNVVVPDGESFTLRTFGFDGGVGEGGNDPTQDCFDDHFGHHDFAEHVNLSPTDLPDLCYAGLAIFSKENMNDDPFDVLRREFGAGEIRARFGEWPGSGAAVMTLYSPRRCTAVYINGGQTQGKATTCVSADQLRAELEAAGYAVLSVEEYSQYELNVTIEALPADSDGDGLTDADEISRGTDPLDADSDDDGLTDGAEVNTHHTNPLDADSDDDGLTDGAEVNTHHTNPLDPDSDHDGLLDGVEVSVGTNPLDADSDDDGIPDGRDPQFVVSAIGQLPAGAFRSPGDRAAMLVRLDNVQKWVAAGDISKALRELRNLRTNVDGCGAAPDGNDWIVDCAAQLRIRQLIDLLIANLSQ